MIIKNLIILKKTKDKKELLVGIIDITILIKLLKISNLVNLTKKYI